MEKAACLSAIKSFLTQVGYDSHNIELNYKYVVNGSVQVADFIAFSSINQKDLKTSCITVKFFENTQVALKKSRDLIFTASPLAIIPTPDEILIFPQRVKEHIDFTRVSYKDLHEFSKKNRISFLPQTLMAIKSEGRQLSLFNLDPLLYEYISEISKNDLVDRFEMAIKSTYEYLKNTNSISEENLSRIIQIAIKILTAKILEDKNILGQRLSGDARDLMRLATSRFPGYFDWKSDSIFENSAARKIYEVLGNDYSYKSISNEQLGFFYENTFVTEDYRKSLGIYYTPQKIAREMLRSLPIEGIDPDKRYVFDGTCGSGSLLTAAFYRLNDLIPSSTTDDRHSYLVKHIYGIDKDPFAVEIAKKSLLLASLPLGDSWQIREGDFLSCRNLPVKPNIIVANPPFKELDKGVRDQKAVWFLEKYIDLLPERGLLSIVLPETFLKNISCKNAREKIIGELNIFEIWQLPEGAFPMANFSTVVISGRKKARSIQSAPFRLRRLFDKDEVLSHAYRPINYDFSLALSGIDETLDENNRFLLSITPTLWEKLKPFDTIEKYFIVFNGIRPGIEGKKSILPSRTGKSFKYLVSPRFLEPYKVNWQAQLNAGVASYIEYPGTLERPRKSLNNVFVSQKVLINANRSPASPWRINAAIDREGIFISQGFHALFPKENCPFDMEVLTGILNSHIPNAFLDSYNRSLAINCDLVKRIPLPSLDDRAIEEIKSLVRGIEAMKQDFSFQPSDVSEMQIKIDEILLEAYGLEASHKDDIVKIFAPYKRPGLPFTRLHIKKENQLEKEIWKVTGSVINYNLKTNELSLWIMGMNSMETPITIQIPPSFPGWAFQRYIDFEAKIPFSQRKIKDPSKITFLEFIPLKNQYIDDDDIVAEFEDGWKNE